MKDGTLESLINETLELAEENIELEVSIQDDLPMLQLDEKLMSCSSVKKAVHHCRLDSNSTGSCKVITPAVAYTGKSPAGSSLRAFMLSEESVSITIKPFPPIP